MAVSTGHDAAGHIEHFCTLDKTLCFPPWLLEGFFEKHVPSGRYARFWEVYHKVRVWDFDTEATEPNFTDPGKPLASGSLLRNDSLLFAVQVAAHLGFARQIFLGVDLTTSDREMTNDELLRWWPMAKDAGITWENASPVSRLQEWMPDCVTEERLVLA
jgi:hypothetical protein